VFFVSRVFRSAAFIGFASATLAASWQSNLTHDPPGPFPQLRPCHAVYSFSWGGVVAAAGDIRYTRGSAGEYQAEAQGHTQGAARMLWKYDVTHRATAEGASLRPLEMKQVEDDRGKKITIVDTFTREAASSTRTDSQKTSNKPPKIKETSIPDLFDLSSALLYLRSQALADKSVYRIAVLPETSTYLTTVTVVGREKVRVHAGSYSAIKIDIQLNKVGKNLELEPHKKFKHATVWLSDDPDRIPVRIEAAVFVGNVTAELQSINFDNAPAAAPVP